MTEDEMVGWHHRLSGHEFGQVLGDGEGQRSPVCCSPRGRKESDTSERLNNNNRNNSGNVPQVLLFRCFREELKQRIRGRACPLKGSPHRLCSPYKAKVPLSSLGSALRGAW